MFTFHDSKNRQFQVRVDVFAARRVKQATGLAIETYVQPNHQDKWDRVALFEALLAICQPSRQNVSDEEFALVLSDGDTAQAAAEALEKAVIDFLPQRQKSLMLSLAEKQKRLRDLQLDAAPAMFDAMMQKQEQAMTEIRSKLSSGNSPESPESTPPASPSAT